MEDTILSILASCFVVALAVYLLAVRRLMDGVSVEGKKIISLLQAKLTFFSWLILLILAYFDFRGIRIAYTYASFVFFFLFVFHFLVYEKNEKN